MSARLSLVEPVPALARMSALELAAHVRGLVGRVTAGAARVSAMAAEQNLAAGQLVTWALELEATIDALEHHSDGAADVTHDVDEVATITHRSVSWVQKRGHTLPGFVQPGGKGSRIGWKRAELIAWANGHGR